MKTNKITLHSFLTKCAGMFDDEKDLVCELIRDWNILFDDEKYAEMKEKYSTLLVRWVVRFREIEHTKLRVVEIND